MGIDVCMWVSWGAGVQPPSQDTVGLFSFFLGMSSKHIKMGPASWAIPPAWGAGSVWALSSFLCPPSPLSGMAG